MAIILQPKRWTEKPPLGVQIQRGHPLAPDGLCVLCNEGAGQKIVDLVQGFIGAPSQAGNPYQCWDANYRGVAAKTIWNPGASINWTTDSFVAPNEITVVLAYWVTDQTFHAAGACGTASTPSFVNAHIPWNDNVVYWDFVNNSAGRLSVGGLSFGNDIWVFNAGPRGMEIWQNGILRASQVGHSTGYSTTSGFWTFGDSAGTGVADNAQYAFNYVYRKQLPQGACQEISRAPYQFLIAPLNRRYFIPGTVAAGANQPCPFIVA